MQGQRERQDEGPWKAQLEHRADQPTQREREDEVLVQGQRERQGVEHAGLHLLG